MPNLAHRKNIRFSVVLKLKQWYHELMILIIVLFLLILISGCVEYAMHCAALRSIPIRVLVNGTRGKTSVTRLVAAVLRGAGYVTYAKSTGTEAVIIGKDGGETPVKRPFGPRLTEQIPFIRLARAGKADAIVVECMAVQPESQFIMAHRLVKPTLTLLTNARVDHVDEMGASVEETLRALSFSITSETTVISNEPLAVRCAAKTYAGGSITVDPEYFKRFSFMVFEDNIKLTLAAAAHLGIDTHTAMEAMPAAKPDIGMAGPFTVGQSLIINAFAANDVVSTGDLLDKTQTARGMENASIWLVFNNRADREYRLRQFLPLIRGLEGRLLGITVLGDHKIKLRGYFLKNTNVKTVQTGLECLDFKAHIYNTRIIILCLGNIKGEGAVYIRRCTGRKEDEHAS